MRHIFERLRVATIYFPSVLADLATSLNYDLANCTLSYSTIARYRQKHQLEWELATWDRIDNCNIRYKTLHFDVIRLTNNIRRDPKISIPFFGKQTIQGTVLNSAVCCNDQVIWNFHNENKKTNQKNFILKIKNKQFLNQEALVKTKEHKTL